MAEVKKSSPLLIAVAWIIVVVPTAWGLDYTVRNALKLFTAPPPPTVGVTNATPSK